MQGEFNGYNYDTFLIKNMCFSLKSKKKKLALTLFYCPVHEKWLDDSLKLVYINQSKLYNFFHVGKFKNI